MKKLLSLLSVLTVSGTAIPTTVAASSYQNVNCKCKCSTLLKKNKVLHLHLQFTGLNKQNLCHHGKKYKRKGRSDNRGKLDDKFKSIWDIENKKSDAGWFEMDTVVGKNHQSSCLILVQKLSKNYFVMKLKNHTANEVVEKFKDIVISNNLIGKMKGIIIDSGK